MMITDDDADKVVPLKPDIIISFCLMRSWNQKKIRVKKSFAALITSSDLKRSSSKVFKSTLKKVKRNLLNEKQEP